MSIQAISFNASADRLAKTGKRKAEKQQQKSEQPIKSGFEYLDATKACILGALALSARILCELDFWTDIDFDGMKKNKSMGRFFTFASIGFLGLAAVLTVATLPKCLYKKKKEIYVKKKEVDSFVKTNSAEQKIYSAIDAKATNADEKTKQELAQQYLKMRSTKDNNRFPVYYDKKNKLPENVKVQRQ